MTGLTRYPSGAAAAVATAPGLSGLTQGRFVGVTTSGAPSSGTFAVGDYAIDPSGQIYACTVAGAPGTWVNPSDTRNLLTTGEETMPRDAVSSAVVGISSQVLRLSYFTARKTETTTQVKMWTGSTAAGATPTLCRMGLYSIDATTGDGTLVASVANDTTLWAAATTAYTRSWSTPYAKVAGQRYAFAAIIVSGAAIPQFIGIAVGTSLSSEYLIAPKLGGALASQSDLPSTFLNSSVVVSVVRHYASILP